MHINTAIGEIRRYYLNLPKDDMTEGGKFTGEVLLKLVTTTRADERAKVLSEVEELLIEHFAGSGELFFPYVGCGASSKADEREFAKQVILDALGRKRVYDKK